MKLKLGGLLSRLWKGRLADLIYDGCEPHQGIWLSSSAVKRWQTAVRLVSAAMVNKGVQPCACSGSGT